MLKWYKDLVVSLFLCTFASETYNSVGDNTKKQLDMNPTELKSLTIGDLVSYNGTPIKVENIHGDCINYSSDIPYVQEESFIDFADVKPITLTLEILERNRFELRDGFLYHRIDDKPYHYDFKLKNGGVFTSEGYTLECGIYHLTIRYVHELQNVLRLCDLNDLADNFKLEE